MKKLLMTICLTTGLGVVGFALPRSGGNGATVKDSTIKNVNKNVNITARNRSSVNTGIQARGANIRNSILSNKFSGNVDANNSTVTTGIKADGASIRDSKISTDTKANIRARNSTVKTGADISGASNARIKTRYRGNINASGAIVKAGSVEGNVRNKRISTDVNENINARGRGVAIGTVKAGGGRPSVYKGKEGLDFSRERGRGGAKIGNVTVNSGAVREVKTSVGTGNVIEGMKTRHMARVHKKTGGIDPSGTKHVYVNKRDKERAKKMGGAVGNTSASGGRIRKVNTFVE